jgi:hypothetical protein
MRSVTLPDIAKTRPAEPMLEHEIRIRAYDLYEQRGKLDGHALEDWLQAEAELLGRVLAQDLKRPEPKRGRVMNIKKLVITAAARVLSPLQCKAQTPKCKWTNHKSSKLSQWKKPRFSLPMWSRARPKPWITDTVADLPTSI